MPSAERLYSVTDVRALPDDGNRYETIAGELFVTPAPTDRHQIVLAELLYVLMGYTKRHNLGRVLPAPRDVVLDPLTLVQPDLHFLHIARAFLSTEPELTAAPDLAVEIVSPSSARTDRGRKRLLYQAAGAQEYWIVDPELRQVEVWRPGAAAAEVCAGELRWQPDPRVEPLVIDLPRLFRDAGLP